LNRCRWGASSFVCLTLVLFAWRCAAAQLVATKDLTQGASDETKQAESPQEPRHIPPTNNSDSAEKGDCVVGFRDGIVVPKAPEKLQLEIVDVDPKVVHPGTALLVTVRLKNVGASGVHVPWDSPLVKPDVDPKTGNLSWDAASINLSIATQAEWRNSSQLKGEAMLVAAPSHREQHAELLPGQWLEVKFKVAVECIPSGSLACRELPANEHAELTAHWLEWLSTHEENGCNVWKGTYNSRKADSKPFPVVYVPASPAGEK